MSAKQSRRQELRDYTNTGRLRNAVEGKISENAADLLIDIVLRYCEYKPRKRRIALG